MRMIWDGRIKADARNIPLANESVQMVCTSPPYWGLRDYGTSGQIGLEPTPEEYVAAVLKVFQEVRRVLRDDGTVWLNLGDSYCGGGRGGNPVENTYRKQATNYGSVTGITKQKWPIPSGLKPKDLVGIPWRVAFALQEAGWYLRSDIIWSKPNPMPESVKDRPTRAHEYIFLLSKSARYYYDADAIREPTIPDPRDQRWGTTSTTSRHDHSADTTQGMMQKSQPGFVRMSNPKGRNKRSVWTVEAKHHLTDPQAAGHRMIDNVALARANGAPHDQPFGEFRNKRSVWTIATQPYPDAHYATFPEEIPEICIKAGSKPGDLILDPFFGSGTVGRVAERLSRRWIGTDLGYQDLQGKRLRSVQRVITEIMS